jgi:hypothetical protein
MQTNEALVLKGSQSVEGDYKASQEDEQWSPLIPLDRKLSQHEGAGGSPDLGALEDSAGEECNPRQPFAVLRGLEGLVLCSDSEPRSPSLQFSPYGTISSTNETPKIATESSFANPLYAQEGFASCEGLGHREGDKEGLFATPPQPTARGSGFGGFSQGGPGSLASGATLKVAGQLMSLTSPIVVNPLFTDSDSDSEAGRGHGWMEDTGECGRGVRWQSQREAGPREEHEDGAGGYGGDGGMAGVGEVKRAVQMAVKKSSSSSSSSTGSDSVSTQSSSMGRYAVLGPRAISLCLRVSGGDSAPLVAIGAAGVDVACSGVPATYACDGGETEASPDAEHGWGADEATMGLPEAARAAAFAAAAAAVRVGTEVSPDAGPSWGADEATTELCGEAIAAAFAAAAELPDSRAAAEIPGSTPAAAATPEAYETPEAASDNEGMSKGLTEDLAEHPRGTGLAATAAAGASATAAAALDQYLLLQQDSRRQNDRDLQEEEEQGLGLGLEEQEEAQQRQHQQQPWVEEAMQQTEEGQQQEEQDEDEEEEGTQGVLLSRGQTGLGGSVVCWGGGGSWQ